MKESQTGTVNLSRRLLSVASLISKGRNVADVGCDHGYLSIYLIEQKKANHIIATDIHKGPVMCARKNITGRCLQNKIDVRLGDGLKVVQPGEADCVVMAGMGGPLAISILEASQDVCKQVKEFVIQPQSDIPSVRHYLVEHEYVIVDEKMVYEDGKYYQMMKAVPEAELPKEKAAEAVYESEADFLLGKWNLIRRDRVFLDYLTKCILEDEKLLGGLCRNIDSKKAADRRNEIEHRKSIYASALQEREPI